jgi:hypothetical protein
VVSWHTGPGRIDSELSPCITWAGLDIGGMIDRLKFQENSCKVAGFVL